MGVKTKALIAGLIGVIILGAAILYLSYIGLKEDPKQVKDLKSNANEYLSQHFDEPYQIVDTLYDNVDVYEQFDYAAIVKLDKKPFNFLVYKHSELDQYMDSFVAEKWEYELENYLKPLLNEAYGEENLKEFWLSYPKDIGEQLKIDQDNVPSLTKYDANPIIRITLNREKKNDDEKKLEKIIDQLQDDLKIEDGHITLGFNDSALIFKDKDIRKEF